MKKIKNTRHIDPRILTILLIVVVQHIGAAMALPIIPLYARREFAMSPQVITLLVSSFFAAQFFAGPWLGRLSDRHGRLPILIISQIGTVISFVMIAAAQNPETLFAARILDGITGGNIIVAQAYITDIMPRDKRTQALGYVMAGFGVGFVLGPALGGLLSALAGARMPFVVAAIAATLTVILTWLTLDETITPEKQNPSESKSESAPQLSLTDMLHNGRLMVILSIAFGSQFAMGLLIATFALYGEEVLFKGYTQKMTDIGIGLLLAMIGVGQIITQVWILPYLVKHYQEGKLVAAGSLTRAGTMLALALIRSPWPAAPGMLFFAAGGGIMLPPLQSMATDTAADESRGNVLGIFQSARSLATIFSTALGGWLFAFNPATPYWLGMVLFFAAALPVIWMIQGPNG